MQVLNLIFGIITARILNDSDYGMVGMLSIFSLIAGSLQESGFTAALANKQEARHEDYNAVFWFCSGLSLCLYLILAGCAPDCRLLSQRSTDTTGPLFFSGILHCQSRHSPQCIPVPQPDGQTESPLVHHRSDCFRLRGSYHGLAGLFILGIATQSIVYVSVINLCYLHFPHGDRLSPSASSPSGAWWVSAANCF